MTEGRQQPTILLIATGGTISMVRDAQTGKSVAAWTARDLLAQTSLTERLQVRTVDFVGESRPYQYADNFLALARCLQQEARSGVDGVVVTHGTDTMEEIAYFIDEVMPVSLPVVFTGAMRPGWAAGYDGIRNLENALRVAALVPAEYGTLVTMNDEIFEAWSVYKADTEAPDAFMARRGAPTGRIYGDQVEYAWRPVHRSRFGVIPESLPAPVPIVTLGVADDASLLDGLSQVSAPGVVIASMAAGNIPPAAYPRVLTLAETGFPVVLCSSATSGRTAEEYYYPRAYEDLTAAGVVIEDRLNPRKTRIRLLLSLGLRRPYVPFGGEFIVKGTAGGE